jgi:transposase InsO family protein
MEADLVAQRAALFCLSRQHPEWTYPDLAAAVGRSESWVKKWLARLKHTTTADLMRFQSRSHARHTPSPSTPQPVVERILSIRDDPPNHLRRVPGPRTIVYFLHQDPEALALGVPLPRSTRTVWKVLRAHGRIATELPQAHHPLDPPEPLAELQADFTDIGSVPAEPGGKRQHAVEACFFEDVGSRQVPYAEVRSDFHAETALLAVIGCLRRTGLVGKLTFDRDPRWVGSPSGRDFPSALIRLLLCLGIEPNVCPPRQPQKKGYVERLIKTYQGECLLREHPETEEAAREATEAFLQHYHAERPHQGRGLSNRPPLVAFPTLPTRPPLPEVVDPDRWLAAIHGQAFARTVQPNGSVAVDQHHYYIKQALAGQKGVLVVYAPEQTFEVRLAQEVVKSVPIKGLVGQALPFEEYATRMLEEARSEHRRWLQHQRRLHQLSLWAS